MDFFNALFREERLYFDLFDQITDAIYICDTEHRLVYFNKAAETLDGFDLKEVKGKTVEELYGIDEKTSPALRALTTEQPVINEKFTYYINGKENLQICFAGPIYSDGKLSGCYSIQRNVTALKEIVETNIALQRAIAKEKKKNHNQPTKNSVFSRLVGQSQSFTNCLTLAEQAAKTDSSIMLVGETGSGKEGLARAIHDLSNRAEKPFLALNCAAIPESLLEGILFGTKKGVYTGALEKEGILSQADGGTIFLDELNSMPLSSQSKLLRVLEEKKIMKLGSNKEKKINVRIISSTNENPRNAILSGKLREDLFYRLSVVQITIPPLRERREDIPDLTEHFIKKYNARFDKNILGIENEVMDYFMSFSWPGNVRQLKACVESAMNFASNDRKIHFSDLPPYIFENGESPEDRYRQMAHKTPAEQTAPIRKKTDGLLLSEEIRQREKEDIIETLKQTKGNVSQAARLLGMRRQSLQYRMKKYNIK
ncbi:MAG: sigma 54-interacting transcriptional regulator [Firmicutes bacterium]|nr:sigma 54-interacting transcriptional regulator [Bacillota bacterium]